MTSSIVPYLRSDKLSVVCVSDHEYPPRVAHTMMQRIGEDFAGEKRRPYFRDDNTLYIVSGQIDPSQWTGGEQVAGFNDQCEVGA